MEKFKFLSRASAKVARNKEGKVYLILPQNAGVNDRDSFGGTTLMDAASKGETEKVAKLVKEGADIDAVDMWGQTPLMGAVWNGNLPTIKTLINLGAKLDIVNCDGETVFDYAKTQEVRDLLVEASIRKVSHADRSVTGIKTNSAFCRE